MNNIVSDTRVLDAMLASADGKADRAVSETAFAVQGKAAITAPYETGALSNSITAEQESQALWIVRDGVLYGLFQEMGTYKMPAQPFMVPSVESERQPFIARLGAVAKP